MTCRSVRDWLHRDAETLSDADRLLFEDHLEGCDDCRRARAQLQRVRGVVSGMPIEPLGAQAHQRAIAKAMLHGPAPATHRALARRGAWLGAAALAGSAVLAWWLVREPASSPSPSPSPQVTQAHLEPRLVDAAAPPANRVETGRLLANGVDVSDVPTNVALEAPEAARVVLGRVTLALAAATTFRWNEPDHTLFLDSGTMHVELAPAAGLGLRIVTERFTVEVTGTAFEISGRGVAVSHGSVRVLAPDGAVIVARVAAGESWTVPKPDEVSARTWLERAHKAFGSRDCTGAEHHANAALDARPSQAQVADARMVLAECAQAAGRIEDAIRRYDAIATRFATLPAGETALIAAARLEMTRGRTAQARAFAERYVSRHPKGRFLEDARRFLREAP